MNKLNLINGGLHKSGNTMCIAEWLAEDARTHGARVETIHPVDRQSNTAGAAMLAGVPGVVSSRTTTPGGCEQLDRAQGAMFCSFIFGGS